MQFTSPGFNLNNYSNDPYSGEPSKCINCGAKYYLAYAGSIGPICQKCSELPCRNCGAPIYLHLMYSADKIICQESAVKDHQNKKNNQSNSREAADRKGNSAKTGVTPAGGETADQNENPEMSGIPAGFDGSTDDQQALPEEMSGLPPEFEYEESDNSSIYIDGEIVYLDKHEEEIVDRIKKSGLLNKEENFFETTSDEDGGTNGALINFGEGKSNNIFINGVKTSPEKHRLELKILSGALGNKPVTGIYNKTDGIVADGLEATADRIEAVTGIRPGDNPAVDSLVDAILNTKGPVTLYGHSQGTAIISAALERIKLENPNDLRRLEVVNMGGFGATFPFGPKYHNYSHTGDLIPNIRFRNSGEMIKKDPFVSEDGNFSDPHSAFDYILNFKDEFPNN